jgi:hypothetical protein
MLAGAGEIVAIEWLRHGGLPLGDWPEINMRANNWSIAGTSLPNVTVTAERG